MSVKAPILLMQEINRGIAGVEKALDNYPRSISTGVMPLVLTFPGDGSTTGNSNLFMMERQYMIDVYVDPVTQGRFDDPVQKTMDLIDEFNKVWNGLKNDQEKSTLDYGEDSGFRIDIDRVSPITDSGFRMDMEWLPNVYYFGFRLTIPILVRWGTGLL